MHGGVSSHNRGSFVNSLKLLAASAVFIKKKYFLINFHCSTDHFIVVINIHIYMYIGGALALFTSHKSVSALSHCLNMALMVSEAGCEGHTAPPPRISEVNKSRLKNLLHENTESPHGNDPPRHPRPSSQSTTKQIAGGLHDS